MPVHPIPFPADAPGAPPPGAAGSAAAAPAHTSGDASPGLAAGEPGREGSGGDWIGHMAQGAHHTIDRIADGATQLEVLVPELRRAGFVLMQILAMAMAAAVLGVTAWLALWGVAVAVLVELGWHAAVAHALAAAISLGAAVWVVRRARRLLGTPRSPRTWRLAHSRRSRSP